MLSLSRRLALLLTLGVAALRAETLDQNYNANTDGIVYALASYPGGRTLVGGAFQRLGGTIFPWIGRLNANGSVDFTFFPLSLNGVVRAIAVQADGKILVGGQFSSVNAQPRNRIARLNADGSIDFTFNPGTGLGTTDTQGTEVRCILLQSDGKILIAGAFESYNGQPRTCVARLNPDGSLDPSFGNVNARDYLSPAQARGAFSLARQADGKILFGGQFLNVGVQARAGLARVNADGSLDESFNPASGQGNYNAIVVQPDGRILVAGSFSTLAGFNHPFLVRLNPDGSADRSYTPSPNNSVVGLFPQADGRLVVSGFFSSIGGQLHAGFARLTEYGAADESFNPNLVWLGNTLGPVNAVLVQADRTTMVGGNFTSIAGTSYRNLARLQAPARSRLVNLSTRGYIAPGADLTVGIVTRGGTRSLLLRGIGPGLGAFGVPGALADPRLEVIPGGSVVPTSANDDWGSEATPAAAFAAVGAFALTAGSKDSALITSLASGTMTARITGTTAAASGIALAEIYDRDSSVAGGLLNLSTLGFVGVGAQSLAPGFVIGGDTVKTLLVRAVGPGLSQFGVTGVLVDPQLDVVPLGSSTRIAGNDNWGSDPALIAAFASAGAFALPAGSRDAAILLRLAPGAYTVNVSGVANTVGRAIVEIYDLDP
ncbi:MAG TPA: delta-60 repeat domain-containing protein [Opitutaceae bacterium]|nr:delta-60 repeat domain-containing protein [Opitutaceae bacterium]